MSTGKMMNRQGGFGHALGALGLSALLALSACSGSGGGGTGQADNPTPTPTPNNTLPPDPGQAGKETLTGVDSNNDGVRDDIEIAIAQLEMDTPAEKDALSQLASSVVEAIRVGDPTLAENADAIRQAAEGLAMAVDCASYQFGVDAADRILLLELLALDTPERAAAYENFNAQTVGQQFGAMSSQEVACE